MPEAVRGLCGSVVVVRGWVSEDREVGEDFGVGGGVEDGPFFGFF